LAVAGGTARHSVGGAPDRSRRRPLAAARYNARHAVAILSEHEPVPSSRETTASAVSSLNRLVNRKKPYIDDVINGVVHALSLFIVVMGPASIRLTVQRMVGRYQH